MTDTPSANDGRSRHWLIDAVVGGGLALGLITAADAALPRMDRAGDEPRVAQWTAQRLAPAAPAEPPALIAFREPIPGYPVISPFGLRQLPWEEAGRLHAGVDIAAPAGLAVVAAADGVVTRAGVEGGYGRFVEVKHAAGLSTVYAHLGRIAPGLASGVAVKAGTPVGAIGSTGTSTGAHLHFEIRDERARPLNPELFLGRRFAETRDLPLRAAQRFPRHVRVAYVSNIPKSKRDEMKAKLEAELALAEAEDAAATKTDDVPRIEIKPNDVQTAQVRPEDARTAEADAGRWRIADIAPSAAHAAVNVSDVAPQLQLKNGRPHARLRVAD